jgi:hypothetical protein
MSPDTRRAAPEGGSRALTQSLYDSDAALADASHPEARRADDNLNGVGHVDSSVRVNERADYAAQVRRRQGAATALGVDAGQIQDGRR